MDNRIEDRVMLKNEVDGVDKLSMMAVRYYDKYVKIDGRWWIAEREQRFIYTCFPPMM